jgi:AcrR family transcriptional regulator
MQATVKAKKPGRGRPRRVTREHYVEAILSIRGREPSIDDLCEVLGVSKATFYNHIPGHDALVEFAGDVICEAMVLPEARPDMHWSEWCVLFAGTVRTTLEDYPIFLQQMSPRAGQMGLLERVLERLTSLGLDSSTALYAFFAVTNIVTSTANSQHIGQLGKSYQEVAPTFSKAVESTPETPLLHALIAEGYSFSSATVFDDILRFTLEGIARERGEVLPALQLG